jgi:hypothetical protein
MSAKIVLFGPLRTVIGSWVASYQAVAQTASQSRSEEQETSNIFSMVIWATGRQISIIRRLIGGLTILLEPPFCFRRSVGEKLGAPRILHYVTGKGIERNLVCCVLLL